MAPTTEYPDHHRIVVCGSRTFTDMQRMVEILRPLKDCKVFLGEGGARGADRMALEIAKRWGWEWREYPALWGQYGRAAGPMRNAFMLLEHNPDAVYAFYSGSDRTRGTQDMVTRSKKADVPTVVVFTGRVEDSS